MNRNSAIYIVDHMDNSTDGTDCLSVHKLLVRKSRRQRVVGGCKWIGCGVLISTAVFGLLFLTAFMMNQLQTTGEKDVSFTALPSTDGTEHATAVHSIRSGDFAYPYQPFSHGDMLITGSGPTKEESSGKEEMWEEPSGMPVTVIVVDVYGVTYHGLLIQQEADDK